MNCKALFALSFLGSLCVVGCGGGGGGSTPPVSPTITSVSVSCAPTSVQTAQTSQCSATVSGTGSYSSAVTWSADSGTISSSGLYTAPATVPTSGSASIKATSTQDSTKSGSAKVTVTAIPVTITSVAVACSPSSILTTQTSTCTPTVTGTGNYSTTVTWSVSPAGIGAVSNGGIFTPAASGAATVTATSTQDTTKSGNAVVTVATPTTLVVTITDLPAGADANVTITDPNGQRTTLASSQIINAIPGTYMISAAPIVVGTSTYNALLASQTVIVTAGNATTAVVDYKNVIPSTTKVLDTVALSSLSASSDGLTLTMSASSTVAQSLGAGDVIVVPPTAASGVAPMGMLRYVVSINNNNSQVVATTRPGTLAEAFQRVDFQIQDQLKSATIQAVHTVPGVIFRSGASLSRYSNSALTQTSSQPVSDPCGGYSLGIFDVPEPIQITAVPGLTLSGSIEVCSGLNFSVDIIGTGFLNLQPTVNSLTATASMGEYSDLTLQGTLLSGSFDPAPTKLATLDFPPVEVPGLPVWVTPVVSIFVGANGNITSGISTEVSSAGTFTGGVTYASGSWSPVPLTPSFQFAYQPPTLSASLSAKAFAGVEFDLYVYDVVGPSFKPDGYLDLEANIANNPWWALTGGIEGPMSLDVTVLGENLASYDFGTLFNYSYPIASASGPFSPPVNNPIPTIISLAPSLLTVGSAPHTLTINGSGFVATSSATFNQVPHPVTFVSSSQIAISLTSPDLATAGIYPVVVTNPSPGGGASAPAYFTVNNPVPSISGLLPSSLPVGSPGQSLTINGTGFVDSSSVTFSGVAYPTTFVNTNQLSIYLSTTDLATAGTFSVVVINPAPGGGSSGSANFPVTNGQATNEWTWMSGSSIVNQPGVYGTLGAPAGGNIPGGRIGATNWTDISGNLWLFGGDGWADGYLNDLWEFDPSTQEWAWMSGSNTGGKSGVYGTLGTPAAGNVPGGRYLTNSWTDSNGNLWLFGGYGTDAAGGNDLWEFDPSTKEWTWMSGSNTGGQPGVYGTLGTPAAGNTPGGRYSANTWTDIGGSLWLFGGNGFDAGGTIGFLNDLWKFDRSTKEWTWMGGSSTVGSNGGQPGVYGTLGTPAAGNVPGGRFGATSCTDSRGSFWLFGGLGGDVNNTGGYLNDLWEFDPSTKEWTWMGGSNTVGKSGVYGTLGMPAAGNVPGSRIKATSWTDSSGNFWLFGGYGIDANGNQNDLNDLWEFNPATKEWTWMGGSSNGGRPGVYGTLGTPAAGNVPGSRDSVSSWTDHSGNLWLFGGEGSDGSGSGGDLNDLWRYQP